MIGFFMGYLALLTVSILYSIGWQDDELEWIWKESVMAQLRYYPGICLGGLRKNMKNHTIASVWPKFELSITLRSVSSVV
jgi:hypothetical protein